MLRIICIGIVGTGTEIDCFDVKIEEELNEVFIAKFAELDQLVEEIRA